MKIDWERDERRRKTLRHGAEDRYGALRYTGSIERSREVSDFAIIAREIKPFAAHSGEALPKTKHRRPKMSKEARGSLKASAPVSLRKKLPESGSLEWNDLRSISINRFRRFCSANPSIARELSLRARRSEFALSPKEIYFSSLYMYLRGIGYEKILSILFQDASRKSKIELYAKPFGSFAEWLYREHHFDSDPDIRILRSKLA